MKKLRLFAILALAAFLTAAFVIPNQSAFAQEEDERTYDRLELYYERLQLSAESLQLRLNQAGNILATTDELIATLEESGFDTTELVAARDAYAAAVQEAQAGLNNAVAILDGAAGFDENGEVVDPEVAIDTLRDGRLALRQAQNDFDDATIDFRIALREIREAYAEEQA
ncbi:MAG: hypothetical protein ACFB51_01795 [Anaerolineae bacterium]